MVRQHYDSCYRASHRINLIHIARVYRFAVPKPAITKMNTLNAVL